MLCILRFGRGWLVLKVPRLVSLFILALFFSFALCAEEGVETSLEKGEGALPLIEEPPPTPAEEIALTTPLAVFPSKEEPQGYTINYNTVSILEYLRFASKICNTNFIFNNEDLDFAVTVVSDAPITPENVMSTLIQVLRMHGLELLEQDNNLVIHKAADVHQIATLVTESGQGGNAAIVTRIFRVNNAKVESLAAIIRPMISASSLLEISSETRQLILTDIRTNVEKVSKLIEILDSPSTLLEVSSYEVLHNSPELIVTLTSKIMQPIAQGNPFVLEPHSLTDSVYIVSTPELIAKAIGIMKTIDVPPKQSALNARKLKSENIFIYKTIYQNGEELLKSLKDVAGSLSSSGLGQGDLVSTLESARWISESNSILFVGSQPSIDKIKELLSSLDVKTKTTGEETSFFIYRPQNRSAKEIQTSIEEMVQNLKESKINDQETLTTLGSAKIDEKANTLTFSGEERTFGGVKNILTLIDVKGPIQSILKNSFFLYKPQATSAPQIESSLKSFAKSLDRTKAADQSLIETINNMQLIETHSILFTGTDSSLKRLQEVLPVFDVSQTGVGNQFFIYKPKTVKGDQLAAALKELTENLQTSQFSDPALLRTLQSMKYVKSTNSFLFTGDSASIRKVEELVASIDTPGGIKGEKNFIIYDPKYASREKIETYLKQLSENLGKKGGSEDLISAIRSQKWVDISHSMIFHGSDAALNQLMGLLQNFDTPTQGESAKGSSHFFMYKPQNLSTQQILRSLHDIAENLQRASLADPNLIRSIDSAKSIETTQTIVFTGPPETIEKIQGLLKEVDLPPASTPQAPPPATQTYLLYKVEHTDGSLLLAQLENLAKDFSSSGLKDVKILDTIHTMRYIKETNSLLLIGDPQTLEETKQLLAQYDVPTASSPSGSSNFFMYKPQHMSPVALQKSIGELAANLKKTNLSDPNLINSLETAKFVEATRSILFTGSPETIKKVQTILSEVDVSSSVHREKQGYFIYKVQNTNGDLIEADLDNLAKNFASSGLKDAKILDVIKSIRYVKETNSLLLTGDPKAIEETKQLISEYDYPRGAPPTGSSNFFMYKPQHLPHAVLQKSLSEVVANLKKSNLSDPTLITSLETAKFVEATHSILFTGSPETIKKVQTILSEIDIAPSNNREKPGYFIYKVQNTTGDLIEDDLDNLAKNFSSSGLKDAKILDVIKNIRYVKETNSLLLTGDPRAIEETKQLISEYDYPRTAAPSGSSHFFMYKPQHVSANQLQKSLRDIGENLKKIDLADPNLIRAIETVKYVETTNSLIFTGTQDTIQKIQGLLKDIDLPAQSHAPIQHIGKTTFLLYKLKYANGPQIITSLQTMLENLKKSNTSDQEFLATLESMKYVKETNSLLFTGNEEALKKVETLVEQFDVTGLSAPAAPPVRMTSTGPIDYFLYKPLSVYGPELDHNLKDFVENLKMSGLNDPDLYNAVDSSRWVEKTQSLVFTGTPKALDKIKELLKTFDIATNLPIVSGEPSIQAIDNTSFLVYKLQFHKGDEIQGALRQIAKDLINNNAPVNQNLLNSINSIQWLEVTNSILCSGDQETLTRLRELVKNLDIPLKQVFIEVLVIETSLTNSLSFGLEWGANYKFRNKYAANTFNTNPQVNNVNATAPSFFDKNLGALAPPSTPTPQLIGVPAGGFDLGVIGEVIKHNGETYLTLGSLLNALQEDLETSVLMTPKIIAQDGRTSSLFQGSNIPFLGSFVSNTGNSTVQTANIEYRDIGMSLTVTPVLGNSDIVTLDISFDQSQQISTTGSISIAGQNVSSGITTSKTTMQTTVHVPDQHFLILSGAVNNSNAKVKTGIPCLGGLPLVGAAFSSANDTINHTSLVIFLRPRILASLDDMKEISRDQEEFFRDQAGTPFLQHNFDESMDLIKSINDD